ncbi:MAG: LPS export ABC transporter periplasmic protein LptC [Cyanobacteria bacterium J06600_6]
MDLLCPYYLVNLNIFKATQQLNCVLLLLPIVLWGCQPSNPNEDETSSVSRLDTQLILNNAVLEQSNKRSHTVWKIKAENIIYSDDRQVATLTKVVGNLLESGTTILKLSAETGEIRDNGNIILLNGSVIASDPRNNSIIKSEAVEWRPQENLLLIPQTLSVTNPNLQVISDSGKYFTDTEKFEIQDNVVATSKQPGLRLDSDRLEWQIPQSLIISPGAVKLVHYNEQQTITERLVSDRAELNLDLNQAILSQNIELISADPPLQLATDALTWNYQQRLGKSDRPIQILDRGRQISLTGNRGKVNFIEQLATLQNGVQAVNKLNASKLYARQLTWQMNTESVEAQGNIVYEQSDPKASLRGEKASGTLGNNNIVVTSDGKKQVTSVIEN